MKGYPTKIIKEGRELTLVVESSVLYKADKLSESTGSTSTGKWVCDVWKLGVENLNGRIYTKELAERLVKENYITTVNDGHYADYCNGHEYANAVAVAKNLRVEGDYLKCDLEFLSSSSDYEDKLEELVSKGVAIGVSSVGYGAYSDDGKTIDPESYEVVRIVDFVTMPAGEVYAAHMDSDDPAEPEDIEDDTDDGNEDDKDKGVPSAECSIKSEKFKRAVSEIIDRSYRK